MLSNKQQNCVLLAGLPVKLELFPVLTLHFHVIALAIATMAATKLVGMLAVQVHLEKILIKIQQTSKHLI
jgi:hypothetical protein